MEICSNLAIGMLTNTIYDLAKFAINKFRSRVKEKDLRVLIEQKVLENIPEDLHFIFDSSTFVSYFSSPQFLDVVNAYIEHKIICDYTTENAYVQKYINKSGIICASDVIKYVSDSISELYVRNKVITIPSHSTIEHAVTYILGVTEEVIAKNLSPETSQALFMLNSRADMQHQDIISFLEKLQKIVEQIREKQLAPNNADYEEIRSKYHAVLKNKNSVAHIYLLDKFPFEKFYVPPVLRRSSMEERYIKKYEFREYAQTLISWKNIFDRGNIVYLTGGAGYGKSLFTQKIINDYKELDIFHSEEYLVVCGELKAFYPSGSDAAISVIDFLRASIRSSTLMDVSADFVEHFLNAGRCLILLDALDEVEKSKRMLLHEAVVAFFKNQNPNNKICITSRDRGFIPECNVEVFKICPLNEEQIDKYVNKIIALGKFEKQEKETFMRQSKVLVDKGFLNSFLVLSLLINIYKAELELPENKLELYQKCFEYIANKREKEKTQREFDWKAILPIMKDNTFIELARMGLPNNSNIDRNEIKERLLQVYKTKYGSEAEAENAIEEFLKFCSDRTELFVPTVEDKYKFFHRSFFEYFYSLYIFYRCNDEYEMLEEFLKFDVDSEVFELTVAMLKQKSESKYQALIELMFEKAEEELDVKAKDYSTFNILVLSMQVIDDALYKERFLEILINKKPRILKGAEHIHNLKLVASIYENDAAAYQKICDCYNDEGLVYLYEGCSRFFAMAEKFEEDTKESFFEKCLGKRYQYQLKSRFIYHFADEDEKFYMSVFSRAWNYSEILLETSDETLHRIFKKFNPRDYKSRVRRVRKSIEEFRKFSSEDQEKLVAIMVPSVRM